MRIYFPFEALVRNVGSHIRDASFGDDVGSRALQDAVVHFRKVCASFLQSLQFYR